MAYAKAHLQTASFIIERYTGEEPLPGFLKKYFSENPKHGSRDRKQIAHLCYCFYRLGKSLTSIPIPEKIVIGLFLCSDSASHLLNELNPAWNLLAHQSLEEKIAIINAEWHISSNILMQVFPWLTELSKEISVSDFSRSFFRQPDIFLRLRPGHEEQVRKKLSTAAINFKEISGNCLSLTNQSHANVIETDKEAVIQDLNSQGTIETMRIAMEELRQPVQAWDCCAGSGGKSILLWDHFPSTKITVSDIRPSIIANLKKRFARAGIQQYYASVLDLQNADYRPTQSFNIIIADVPCTGSGTWSRSPEQLYFFDEAMIAAYSEKQKQIIAAVIPSLKPGGFLVYITCSVFRKENEEQLDFMQKKFSLKLRSMKLLTGYDKKADTLFTALLQHS